MKSLGKPFPDCAQCRRPNMKHARESWGCDTPVEQVVFEVTCSACGGGAHLDVGAECPACNGTGLVGFHQCPTAVVKNASPWERKLIETALRAYIQFDNRNVMPVEGGWLEQAQAFGAIVDIIDSERGRYEGEVYEKQERERKHAEAKAKQGGNARSSGAVRRPNIPRRGRA